MLAGAFLDGLDLQVLVSLAAGVVQKSREHSLAYLVALILLLDAHNVYLCSVGAGLAQSYESAHRSFVDIRPQREHSACRRMHVNALILSRPLGQGGQHLAAYLLLLVRVDYLFRAAYFRHISHTPLYF